MKRMMLFMTAFWLLALGCAACGTGAAEGESVSSGPGYRSVSQEEAAAMMERDDGHIVVDVRREEECRSGHIPGAVLIPNESIGTEPPEELPDTGQIILIYCRSGRRSKEAARKLAAMGYTRIYEFGGINTWNGPIETDPSQ